MPQQKNSNHRNASYSWSSEGIGKGLATVNVIHYLTIALRAERMGAASDPWFMNVMNNRLFRVSVQGVKGAIGDPGLPGPTGIRGGFGERVSEKSVCLSVLNCLKMSLF